MSNDMIVYDQIQDPGEFIKQLGISILHSEMFGCTNASQGAVLALECMARKTPPMQLAERYHIIHGRLSMRADAMLADFRERGGTHKIVERTADAAEVELTSSGESQRFRLTWIDAQQEPFVYVGKESAIVDKLASGRTNDLMVKPKYRTPRSRSQMLWARVVSDGVRAMCPEVVAGYYTPEEMGDVEDADTVATSPERVNVVDVPPPPQPAPQRSSQQQRRGVSLSGQEPPREGNAVSMSAPCTPEHQERLKKLAQEIGMPPAQLKEAIQRRGAQRLADLTIEQAERLEGKLSARAQELFFDGRIQSFGFCGETTGD